MVQLKLFFCIQIIFNTFPAMLSRPPACFNNPINFIKVSIHSSANKPKFNPCRDLASPTDEINMARNICFNRKQCNFGLTFRAEPKHLLQCYNALKNRG